MFVFVLVVGVIGGFVLSSNLLPTDSTQTSGFKIDSSGAGNPFGEVLEVDANDAVYGSRDANVVIFEYSDVGCPYCAKFHITGREIVDNSNGQIAWIYRHLPIVRDFSEDASVKLECVKNKFGEGRFWEILDELFSSNDISGETISNIVEKAGLSKSDISRCLAHGSVESDQVKKHINQGRVFGLRGTPSGFVFNRETKKYELLGGALPEEQLQALIDHLDD